MSFDWLFGPVEEADAWLTGLLRRRAAAGGAGPGRSCSGCATPPTPTTWWPSRRWWPPTTADTRAAARLGAWWGLGHASTLLGIGVPLIAFKSELPGWLERGAEKAVGVVIIVLALRVGFKWARGDYRATGTSTARARPATPIPPAGHLFAGDANHSTPVTCAPPGQAFAIGTLHGLAGTGAVVLLLIAALPTQLEALAALAVFAPMSIASMALCTAAFAWVLTRPRDRAALPDRADPRPGHVRPDVRALVHRPHLRPCRCAGCDRPPMWGEIAPGT